MLEFVCEDQLLARISWHDLLFCHLPVTHNRPNKAQIGNLRGPNSGADKENWKQDSRMWKMPITVQLCVKLYVCVCAMPMQSNQTNNP